MMYKSEIYHQKLICVVDMKSYCISLHCHFFPDFIQSKRVYMKKKELSSKWELDMCKFYENIVSNQLSKWPCKVESECQIGK